MVSFARQSPNPWKIKVSYKYALRIWVWTWWQRIKFMPLPGMNSTSQPVKSQYIAWTTRCCHNLFRVRMFLSEVTATRFVKESILSIGRRRLIPLHKRPPKASMLTYWAFQDQVFWGIPPCRLINSCLLLEWSQCVHLRGQPGQESTAGLCFETSVVIYQLTLSTIPEKCRFERLSNFASDVLWI